MPQALPRNEALRRLMDNPLSSEDASLYFLMGKRKVALDNFPPGAPVLLPTGMRARIILITFDGKVRVRVAGQKEAESYEFSELTRLYDPIKVFPK
jgi:hypothetical protein